LFRSPAPVKLQVLSLLILSPCETTRTVAAQLPPDELLPMIECNRSRRVSDWGSRQRGGRRR
jgi:hypothetical protein